MYLNRYPFKLTENFLNYEFYSDGPKGKIRKVIRFTDLGNNIYNLGFGDFDELTQKASDTVITNNKDTRKILATVAATVYDFTERYPDAWVVAKGSTPSRKRLYRIGINIHFTQIKQ